jgi:gamma-glutamyltranspeptidase/glutathione hydrolase
MDIQQAVDAPRFRHLDGLRVSLEPPIGEDVRAALRAMGHDIVPEDSISCGGAQAIIRLPGAYSAGSDPRKDGMAIGW